MKFTSDRPYGDPEKAARKLVEIANSIEPAQEGRIFIELINRPFLHSSRTPARRCSPDRSFMVRYRTTNTGTLPSARTSDV
jgi:hypothetical protein